VSSLEIRRNPAKNVVRYRVRFRLDGKNRAETFGSEDGARRWMALLDAVGPAKALAALQEPRTESARTVADQVAHHIAHLTGISDGTRSRYTGYMDRRIVGDPLGKLPLHMAARDDFAAWVNRLKAVPLSAKTIRNHHSLVSDAMRSAVRAGLIPTNHAEGIRIETPDEDDLDEMVTLTPAEVVTFVQAVPEHWRPMVAFMFGTGVRWQEAAALKVGDVDLDQQQARITRAWKDTGGNGHQLGKPKSRRSRRTIVFEHGTAAAIRSLVEGRKPDAFLFTNTRGGPVRYSNFSEQAWAPAVHVLAGDTAETVKPARGRSRTVWTPGSGKRPTPHDARHTYASTQIARGKSMAHIQRQLGHESITTTLNLYTHLATADLHAELGDLREIEG
jgi:integrase